MKLFSAEQGKSPAGVMREGQNIYVGCAGKARDPIKHLENLECEMSTPRYGIYTYCTFLITPRINAVLCLAGLR